MSTPAEITRGIHFPADHPSFRGHFPGRPIVAGVLLMEQVATALREWRGLRLKAIVDAKFVAPLLPGQDATLTLTEIAEHRMRFTIVHAGTTLARGTVEGST
ncbi:3-hydroxymyristoyl/3-hydroxydecanoyl-(acyl carrier protein) dehydratase [Luteibacter sp. Sphag1AF]|uniref:hydroxymyristoyl-ACP dehydratase n=1 Tax=Luteibacter sp. Sphag1AF TaxID=2587031 RepID=UPI00160E894F|nr:hydroxymyristoyl-ACP dehydratase [Luteibacter sp. Sphag1AF]MBB3226373.1 3-hydroxymyristoyl/3-hydroxydecanoyl-(acyl carrier protein) dehydratase [Luteibacter sp. Sphag1AF]